MNSTLEDVAYAASNRARLVLRGLALAGLTVFLMAALMGAFDESDQSVTPDGAVRADYHRSIRPGNNFDITVSLENASCEGLTVSLDGEYAALFEELAVQPEPDSATALPGGRLAWQFEGGNLAWVKITGEAADGWSPPVTGALGIECGKSYELDLTTRWVP